MPTAVREVPRLLCSPKVHYLMHNSPQLDINYLNLAPANILFTL